MRTIILWASILTYLVPLSAQAPAGAFIYNAGIWSAASTTATTGAIQYVPPASALYCYNSSLAKWVPADSSCFGGGTGSGTVNAGTTGQVGYYASDGTAISGNPKFTVNGNGDVTATSVGTMVSSPLAYFAYGDSITACNTGLTIVSDCYVNHWAVDLGTLLGGTSSATNRGTSGDMAADVVWRIQSGDNPVVAANPALYSLMIGTNDANTNGTGSGTWEANYKLFHSASLAWFAVPSAYKTAGSTATTSGTCSNETTFSLVTGEKCTANASTLTFSSFTTTGGTVYIWYRVISTDTGTFTYAIDGGVTTPVNTGPPINFTTANSHTSSMGLIRVTGVAAGSHSIVFTQTNSGTMSILAIGSVPSSATLNSSALPLVVGADVPNQLDGNILSTTQSYAADARSDISTLQSDGLRVVLAPVNTNLQATTAASDMFNTLHPNDAGHVELYRAFRSAVKQQTYYSIPWNYTNASNGSLSADIAVTSFAGTTAARNYTFVSGNTASSSGGAGKIGVHGGSTTGSSFAIYQNEVQDWQIGLFGSLSKGTNLLIYDQVNGKYIGDFPLGMPQDSYSGNTTGPLIGGTLMQSTIYTAAGTALPTCASGVKGAIALVGDATVNTPGSAYTSGGTFTIHVECTFNSTGSVYAWQIM